jgi:RimJ/RimL family protein N-acetyltransferase
MTYQIVPTTEQHVDGFERVFDTVARELRYLAFTQSPPRQKVVEFLTESLTGGWPHYVALHDGEVVGWCDISSLHRPVFDHAGVLGLGLLPEHRGKGLGRELMGRVLRAAKQKGLSRIELTVRESNDVAIRLYEGLGFVREGLHINSVKINGRYENHISMALFLPENA